MNASVTPMLARRTIDPARLLIRIIALRNYKSCYYKYILLDVRIQDVVSLHCCRNSLFCTNA